MSRYHSFVSAAVTVILIQQLSAKDLLCGHLKPLGEQRPPEITTQEISRDLHPIEFWETFVKPGIPVVFPGAAKNSRAFKAWTEEYLINNFGNLAVKVEARSEEDSRIPVGELGLGKDTIKHFINNYQKVDSYVISQIPQPMEEDIELPSCLRCGSFLQNIQETHLFFSSSGGKTLLHKDPFSSLHCVFNGTKQWLTVHPSQTHLLYQNEESLHEYGGFSEIDVDHVDLHTFPRIRDVKYSKISMNKGDCIFMPAGYWHQVRSNGYMNTATSIWFSNQPSFNTHGCPPEIPPAFPLSQVAVIWRYPGHGDFTHGNHDVYAVQRLLLSWADEKQGINLTSFTQRFFLFDTTSSKRKLLEDDTKRRSQKFIEFLDPSGSGFTSHDKITKLKLEKLKQITLLVAPTDVSNTAEFEYSHIQERTIRALFKSSFNNGGLFDKKAFIRGYTEKLGGTSQRGSEIIAKLLDTRETGSYAELATKLNEALSDYRNSRIHDPSMEQEMHRHLSQPHDEL